MWVNIPKINLCAERAKREGWTVVGNWHTVAPRQAVSVSCCIPNENPPSPTVAATRQR